MKIYDIDKSLKAMFKDKNEEKMIKSILKTQNDELDEKICEYVIEIKNGDEMYNE